MLSRIFLTSSFEKNLGNYDELQIPNPEKLNEVKSEFSYSYRLDSQDSFQIRRFLIYKNKEITKGYIYTFNFTIQNYKPQYDNLDINSLVFLAIDDTEIKVVFTQIQNTTNNISVANSDSYCNECWAYLQPSQGHECPKGTMDEIIITTPGAGNSDVLTDFRDLNNGTGGGWDHGDGFPGGGGGSPSTTPLTKEQIKDLNNKALNDPKVIKVIEDLFKLATSEASEKLGRKEMGAWLFYNKKTGEFKLGKIVEGPYVKGANTKGTVQPPSSSQISNGVDGSFIPTAFVHTHTPLTHEPKSLSREVGFSEADIDFSKNTGTIILIDYIGEYSMQEKQYIIKGGHKIDAPTKITIIHTTK